MRAQKQRPIGGERILNAKGKKQKKGKTQHVTPDPIALETDRNLMQEHTTCK